MDRYPGIPAPVWWEHTLRLRDALDIMFVVTMLGFIAFCLFCVWNIWTWPGGGHDGR